MAEIDLRSLVEEYRTHYRDHFMTPTLSAAPGSTIAIPIEFGDKVHEFRIAFIDMPNAHPNIWCTSVVRVAEDGTVTVTVYVNPQLLYKDKTFTKALLAREYVASLACLAGEKTHASVSESKNLEEFVTQLGMKRQGVSVGDIDAEIEEATGRLLVTEESIANTVAENFGLTIAQLREAIQSTPSESAELVQSIIKAFAATRMVDKDLVADRLNALLMSHDSAVGSEVQISPPAFVIAWDPELVNEDEYAELLKALGNLVRADGGSGLKLLDSESTGVPVGEDVVL